MQPTNQQIIENNNWLISQIASKDMVITAQSQQIEVVLAENARMKEALSTAEELRKIQAGIFKTKLEQAQTANYPGFARTMQAPLAIGAGFGSAYLVYNNPERLVEMLQSFDLQLSLIFGQELAAAGAGVLGYAISSYVGVPVLFCAMKLISYIDEKIKSLLKFCVSLPITLAKKFIEEIKQDIEKLLLIGNMLAGHSTKIAMLVIAGILAYYNPEMVSGIAVQGSQMAQVCLSGVADLGHYAVSQSGIHLMRNFENLIALMAKWGICTY